MKSSVSLFSHPRLALTGFLLAGLFWIMPSLSQAQSSSVTAYGLYNAPAGPYTTSAIAISRVEAQAQATKIQLSNLNPLSQDYKYLMVKYQFYTIIHEQLLAGKTVQESIEAGLKFLGTDAAADLPKSKKDEYKQEAINLLKP